MKRRLFNPAKIVRALAVAIRVPLNDSRWFFPALVAHALTWWFMQVHHASLHVHGSTLFGRYLNHHLSFALLFAEACVLAASSLIVIVHVGREVCACLRPKRGLCRSCGYDLRGTPGSKPCPECGADREAKA